MKKCIFALVAVLVLVPAVVGMAFEIEVGVGTDASVSLGAQWDILTNLSVVALVGVSFGGGVQTGSVTAQTASYTVGVELRYSIPLPWEAIRSYVGLGAHVRLGRGGTQLLVTSGAGLRVNVHRNIYLFGEAASVASFGGSPNWTWRLKAGAGFRFRF